MRATLCHHLSEESLPGVTLPLPTFTLFFLSRYHNTETNMSLFPFVNKNWDFFNISASRTFWRVQSSGIVQYLDCLHCTSISRHGYTHFLKTKFKVLKGGLKLGKNRCSLPFRMGQLTCELPWKPGNKYFGMHIAFTWQKEHTGSSEEADYFWNFWEKELIRILT